eukprot:6691429-Prymnesium_polylepis.1
MQGWGRRAGCGMDAAACSIGHGHGWGSTVGIVAAYSGGTRYATTYASVVPDSSIGGRLAHDLMRTVR